MHTYIYISIIYISCLSVLRYVPPPRGDGNLNYWPTSTIEEARAHWESKSICGKQTCLRIQNWTRGGFRMISG